MALSASYNYYTTRDTILARAFRIIGAISQGETPAAAAVTEAAITLNEIMKEWQADGLQLWKTSTLTLTGAVTGTTTTIGSSGAHVTAPAPLQVLQVYYKNTDSGADTPLIPITKQEYERLTPKATTGTPTQWYYKPPGAIDSAVASGNNTGTIYWFPPPSTAWLADNTFYAVVVNQLMDFDSSSDQPDIPNYLINALVWALADQLCYEYGVGLSERSMISKKAMMHKAIGMSFDQEQGSLYFFPEYHGEE